MDKPADVRTCSGSHLSPARSPHSGRLYFKILVLTYKGLHKTAPTRSSNLLNPNIIRWSLRTSDQGLWVIPLPRLKTSSDRAFQSTVPKLWNSLHFGITDQGMMQLASPHECFPDSPYDKKYQIPCLALFFYLLHTEY